MTVTLKLLVLLAATAAAQDYYHYGGDGYEHYHHDHWGYHPRPFYGDGPHYHRGGGQSPLTFNGGSHYHRGGGQYPVTFNGGHHYYHGRGEPPMTFNAGRHYYRYGGQYPLRFHGGSYYYSRGGQPPLMFNGGRHHYGYRGQYPLKFNAGTHHYHRSRGRTSSTTSKPNSPPPVVNNATPSDSFPPTGCKSSKVCSFTANQDGQRYKVSFCLVKNAGLTAPQGDEVIQLAKEAINQTGAFELSGTGSKALYNNSGFEVDRQQVFKQGGQTFVELDVKHGEGTKLVAQVNVERGMKGVNAETYDECIRKGLARSLKSTKAVWIYQIPLYSYMSFN